MIALERQTVRMPDNSYETVSTLLSEATWNTKLSKSLAFDKSYLSMGLALSPARTSGNNVCSSSSPGCRNTCIYESGLAGVFPSINRQRVAKTKLFFGNRPLFLEKLSHELHHWNTRALSAGRTLCVRLNMFSDLQWESIAPSLFSENPETRFYDYTKHVKRFDRYLSGKLPSNYHLTFSRSEDNGQHVKGFLRRGGNVSCVFKRKPFPSSVARFTVIDGDLHDLRFLDKPGTIVGLSAKGCAGASDETGFIVNSRINLL